jgi:hypothetical protein
MLPRTASRTVDPFSLRSIAASPPRPYRGPPLMWKRLPIGAGRRGRAFGMPAPHWAVSSPDYDAPPGQCPAGGRGHRRTLRCRRRAVRRALPHGSTCTPASLETSKSWGKHSAARSACSWLVSKEHHWTGLLHFLPHFLPGPQTPQARLRNRTGNLLITNPCFAGRLTVSQSF